MSPAITGALLGFGVGLVGFIALRISADRMEKTGAKNSQRAANVLRLVATIDWVAMVLIGFFIGRVLWSNGQ